MIKCDCYNATWKRCTGTREQDPCNCGGDKTKCDIYPEIKQKAIQEANRESNLEAFRQALEEVIDAAMTKKDRYITIFCDEHGISASVYPLVEDEE